MYFLTKKEFFGVLIAALFLGGLITAAVWISIDYGYLKIPEPKMSLIDERVEEKEVFHADALTSSVHNESVLIAKTIIPGMKTEIRAQYLLNDGTSFYTTTLIFTPGVNEAPSAESTLEYQISHSMTDFDTIKECKDEGLDPEVTAVIVTWSKPVNDGYTKYSLMDTNADGQWDLVANEGIKFADSDEEDAQLVYTDDVGNKVFAKYERAKEIYQSGITFNDAENYYLTN